MPTLLKDIEYQSGLIIKAFTSEGLKLDYSINSLIEIDKFFLKHSKDGKAIEGGRLTENLGPVIFSIGAYLGQTIIKNVKGAAWVLDENDPQQEINASVWMPDATQIFPIQRVMKRFQNGPEDAVYIYAYQLTKDYTNESFDQSFWKISS